MAGILRHNGEWVWDTNSPAPDANSLSGNSLLWDGAGNADTGAFASDPQRLSGPAAAFDMTGAFAGAPSAPVAAGTPPATMAPADLVFQTAQLAPPIPNGPTPPVIPPLPPVTPPTTPPDTPPGTLVPSSFVNQWVPADSPLVKGPDPSAATMPLTLPS